MLCVVQIDVPALDETLTLAVPPVLTLIVIALDVAVVGEAHAELDVSTAVIEAPLASVDDVYVAEVAPLIAVPPLYH